MKSSLASSPIVPLIGGIGAAALIFGTLTNGGIDDANAEFASSAEVFADPAADPTLEDPTLGGADATADTAAAATEAVEKGTLTAGKAGSIGTLKLTVKSVSKTGAVVTVSKKSYKLTTDEPAKIGEYTLTVTKVNTAKKRAAISVEGG